MANGTRAAALPVYLRAPCEMALERSLVQAMNPRRVIFVPVCASNQLGQHGTRLGDAASVRPAQAGDGERL